MRGVFVERSLLADEVVVVVVKNGEVFVYGCLNIITTWVKVTPKLFNILLSTN